MNNLSPEAKAVADELEENQKTLAALELEAREDALEESADSESLKKLEKKFKKEKPNLKNVARQITQKSAKLKNDIAGIFSKQEKEKSAEEITIDAEVEKVVTSEFAKFKITPEEIAQHIPEFETLTPGQKLLVAENFEKVVISEIKANAVEKFKAETEHLDIAPHQEKDKLSKFLHVAGQVISKPKNLRILGKNIVRNMFKSVNIAQHEKEAAEEIQGAGIEKHKDALQEFVRGTKALNQSVTVLEGGETVINFGEGFGNKVPSALLKEFNTKANKLANIPLDWEEKNASVLQKRAITQARKEFEEMRNSLLTSNDVALSEKDRQIFLAQAENSVKMQQMLSSTGPREAFEKIAEQSSWRRGFGKILSGTGIKYVAGGYAGRLALKGLASVTAISTFGLSYLALPIFASYLGRARAKGRAMQTLQEQHTEAKRGKIIEGVGETNIVNGQLQAVRLENILERISKAEAAGDQSKVERLSQELKNRFDYIERKMQEGRITFADFVKKGELEKEELKGKQETAAELQNRLKNQYAFSTLMYEAAGAIAVRGAEGNAELERRLKTLLDKSETKISAKEKAYIQEQMKNGAQMAFVGSTLGAALADIIHGNPLDTLSHSKGAALVRSWTPGDGENPGLIRTPDLVTTGKAPANLPTWYEEMTKAQHPTPTKVLGPLNHEGMETPAPIAETGAGTETIPSTGPTHEIPTAPSVAEAPKPALETETPNADAFINKGEGVTHALERQLRNNPEFAKAAREQFGYTGRNMKTTLAKMADAFGYRNKGSEVWVNWEEGQKVPESAYQLRLNPEGKLVVDEYNDGAWTSGDDHSVASGRTFEGENIEKDYEQLHNRPAQVHHTGHHSTGGVEDHAEASQGTGGFHQEDAGVSKNENGGFHEEETIKKPKGIEKHSGKSTYYVDNSGTLQRRGGSYNQFFRQNDGPGFQYDPNIEYYPQYEHFPFLKNVHIYRPEAYEDNFEYNPEDWGPEGMPLNEFPLSSQQWANRELSILLRESFVKGTLLPSRWGHDWAKLHNDDASLMYDYAEGKMTDVETEGKFDIDMMTPEGKRFTGVFKDVVEGSGIRPYGGESIGEYMKRALATIAYLNPELEHSKL